MERFVELVILLIMTVYVLTYAHIIWQQKKDDDKVQEYLKKMDDSDD